MKKHILVGTAAVVLAGFALSACGTSQGAGNGTSDSTQGTLAQAAPSTTRAPAQLASVLNVTDSSLGPIVRDSNGNTLYAFTNDKDGQSSCNDQCAITWPPARKTDVNLTAAGLDPSLMGTTKRKDGTTQLTLNNWPLYRFAADGTSTGSTKGQGSKGVWFVLNASGKLNKAGADATANGSSSTVSPSTATGTGTKTGAATGTGSGTGTKTGSAAGTKTGTAAGTKSTSTTIAKSSTGGYGY